MDILCCWKLAQPRIQKLPLIKKQRHIGVLSNNDLPCFQNPAKLELSPLFRCPRNTQTVQIPPTSHSLDCCHASRFESQKSNLRKFVKTHVILAPVREFSRSRGASKIPFLGVKPGKPGEFQFFPFYKSPF